MKTEIKSNDDLYNAFISGEVNDASKITVNVYGGPIGSYGFRSGWWPIKINNINFSMFASIPHRMDLDEQEQRLLEGVHLAMKRAIEAETYIDSNGQLNLRYTSQIRRKQQSQP